MLSLSSQSQPAYGDPLTQQSKDSDPFLQLDAVLKDHLLWAEVWPPLPQLILEVLTLNITSRDCI